VTEPQRLDGAELTATGEGLAVTPHYLASQAAVRVLDQGGNAVDAAIAANATLGVVAPETCGIGGDLFALIHAPGEDTPATLNASGRAGRGAYAHLLRDRGADHIAIDSPFSVTVPGCVDGWLALNERFGTMPLAIALAPAVGHARNGFAATPELSGALNRFSNALSEQAASIGLFPGGAPPRPGDGVTRPTLAETLAAIGEGGRHAFYDGPVGAAITNATQGVLQQEDLDRDQAEWIEPISVETMGLRGWTIPPNSQGYLTLAAAWIFEHLDPPHDPEDPLFTHAAIEAYRSVAWERDDLVADAESAPAVGLLNPRRLDQILDRISMRVRTPWPAPQRAHGGTAYLCVRDANGMGVSLIQSNYHGIGSRIGAGDAGFFLHDRGSNFTLEPGHPNELAPGKRPLHTLSPTLWTNSDGLAMLLGTRGGDFQPQTLLQALTYMRWAGMDPGAAQRMPRWTTAEWREPGRTVAVEPHLAPAVADELRERGHDVESADGWMGGWGPVSVIVTDEQPPVGAADPRVASTAAVSTRSDLAGE